jgi:hypothetical protein
MTDAFFLAGSISFEIVVPFCATPPVVQILPTPARFNKSSLDFPERPLLEGVRDI